MAMIPKDVFTRRRALVAEYVEDTRNVVADGFTEEHFTVVVEPPTLTDKHKHASVGWSAQSGEVEMYRVYWEPIDQARAVVAMEGDFRETIGAEASNVIDAVRAQLNQ